MTKAKIISEIEDILYNIRDLEDDVYWLSKNIEEKTPNDNVIYDVDKFIRGLNSAKIYNKELQQFMEDYLKFYNAPN